MRKNIFAYLWPALLFAVCLTGCGNGGMPEEQTEGASQLTYTLKEQEEEVPATSYVASAKESVPSGSAAGYQAPEFMDAAYHEAAAQGTDKAKIDLSAVSQGYVAVKVQSDKRIKMRVTKGDVTYDYNVANDGTPCIFPLQSGDGVYSFKIMEQVVDSRYAKLYGVECEVKLEDEFQPFLRPSEYSKYNAESECVKKAAELASKEENALGVVGAVFDVICDNIVYDREKAAAVAGASGYMPDPDDTLATGKGICFDYASLAAAMLRSQGIPTKIVFGYVSPNDVYHAWNMFYTDETGWVSVGYDVEAGSWYRMDTTFSAGGAEDSFVGDGGNYADAKCY